MQILTVIMYKGEKRSTFSFCYILWITAQKGVVVMQFNECIKMYAFKFNKENQEKEKLPTWITFFSRNPYIFNHCVSKYVACLVPRRIINVTD